MEIDNESFQTSTLDHHGLIAATCKDLGIARRIDELLNHTDKERVVTPGESVVAMIINGLGFTNRRLYLVSQFFENKPVERLIAPGLQSSDLTYDTLSHALDKISDYGESELYGRIALDVALDNKLMGSLYHIDTTSVSVEGQYDEDNQSDAVNITFGHSKDHRPDLKQFMLSLVVTGDSKFPLWMELLNGNSSDKTNFHSTISTVRNFQSQLLSNSTERKWVADSALYSKEKLLNDADFQWLTRVPETVKEAKILASKDNDSIEWVERKQGYRTASYESNYGGCKQRWLLVFSEQSHQREIKTLEKRIQKQEEKHKSALKKLSGKHFGCTKDALKALAEFKKKKPFFKIQADVVPIEKYCEKGRPKADAKKEIVGYSLETTIERNEQALEDERNKKGRFILATNDMDSESYGDELILNDYKSQQKVESGFRFLKDPWFMLDSVFLKKPSRVSALMMVMTLCLMVYNVAELRLRNALKNNNETLPNQKRKPISNPTLRWVFQLMEGVTIVSFSTGNKNTLAPDKQVVTNLNETRVRIIRLFGKAACIMYGLNKL